MKAYAKINESKHVEDIFDHYEDGYIEVPSHIIDCIISSEVGHRCYKYVNGEFLFDKHFNQDMTCTLEVVHTARKVVPTKLKVMPEPVFHSKENPHEIGVFGNVWVRKLFFPTKDTVYEGHKHDHDHVSLLMSGRVTVEVEGFEPKEFKAPTYITIKAEHEHKITALEDGTLWWCIHAMRDENDEVVDVNSEDNSPYSKENLK